MKTAGQIQQFKKCIILFMAGIICSALAYATYVINPMNIIFEMTLTMTPTSIVYNMWRKPPVDVFLKVYIFNITNSDEFMNGNDEKLKVNEIGPYVYQEVLENTNVTWHDNGTISYIPKRSVTFRPDLSVGNPHEDFVMVTNIPMLGVFSALSDAGFFVNYPLVQLANMLDSKPILNISVYEFFWGYDDALVHLASTIVPNFISFKKFGLLDRMYDEGQNVVNINIKKNKNMSDEEGRYLSIETYNYSPGLANWGFVEVKENETNPSNTICNQIKGASEGTLFPTYLDKNVIFRVYRKAFCRTLPIVYVGETKTQSGLPGWEYSLANDFLDPANPENECYCRKLKTCLKKGLSDLTPCYYNIPAAVSLPHFLDADPTLLDNIEGLKPDHEKHRSKVILQPTIGTALEVNSRIQTNLVMQPTTYNSKIDAFNGMVIPLFWTDLCIPPIEGELVWLMRMLIQIGPILQTCFICILALAGITTFILSLAGIMWVLNQQTDECYDDRRDSTDLKISLGYGQYTAIRILPAIKKITSKTDLFG